MTEPSFKSEFLRTLQARGFIHQCTDAEALDSLAAKGMITAYIGFDATASSLHAGSLVQIMMLRWLQKTGHKPIVLMGGGTTKVGDPSGKDTQRQMLTDDKISENLNGIKQVFTKFLEFGEDGNQAIMVNNDDWLSGYGYIEFLRMFGTHFTINRMMTFDSVKLRLEREQPLTFLEFNYMLMQAVDFRELNERHGCILQMGGSDQWGNIINGVELTRRMGADTRSISDVVSPEKSGAHAFGLTTPLLTTASGAKMGKTASGAVWLNADLLSPYDYWQYWRNAEDKDVGRFLRLFTELPLDEIARLEALQGAEINDAKKVLADEATKLLHGDEAAATARDTAQKAFEQGVMSADMPTVEIERVVLDEGIMLAALATKIGLTASNGEARRLALGGGLRVNDVAISDGNQLVTAADLTADGVIKVSQGKKKILLVKPV
ncbi:tyrosine--tRNA ligase [Asticcacaulis sp. AC402]|uniref:tyrosine--tRNA ligase n=1 Tax=Asticcacaulis sp. AC402 TaxID=1282361 RepID=UPI0003C3EF45|nr:tyrosine--tRNA ligase [Asticcacaulis sp. AC402]ESQ75303.1 tyrosyl-tRNA synthetase [Asticcacaulis sp. AC402]